MVNMPLLVDAVYKNGVLRPLQPLDLKEQEHVIAKCSRIHHPVAAFTERSSLLRKESRNSSGPLELT